MNDDLEEDLELEKKTSWWAGFVTGCISTGVVICISWVVINYV